jgi:predicted negative regulator of RcsB-dependent stress response
MDEDLTIINTNTRNEKIKNFFLEHKKKIIFFTSIIILILLSYLAYNEFRNKQKVKISNLYNSIIIDYSEKNKNFTADKLVNIVGKKDTTYSPLALYFIIDNELIVDTEKINDLFDIIINKTSLENEIRNLIIYKKALYNADTINESELLDILNPLINSKSVWKSHALYLTAEYFYSKNEKQKSTEFFMQILSVDNANQDIIKKAQKRLNRDLSE